MREEEGLIARLESLAAFLDAQSFAYEFHVASDAAETIQRLLNQTDRDRSELVRMDALLAEERQQKGREDGPWWADGGGH